MNVDILSNRTVSTFPLSVATSLAFESMFTGPLPPVDPEREPPLKIEISKYKEIWINLFTLFRNLIGSLSKEDAKRVSERELVVVLEQEIDTIISILRSEGRNTTQPVFYVCNYTDIHRPTKYPHAKLRVYRTPGQLAYKSLYEDTIKLFQLRYNKFKGEDRPTFYVFDSVLKTKDKVRALILTHIPYDLLSHKNFYQLDLLESHTGMLKPKVLWYTKFYQGKDLPMIPFNEGFLQIFGDTETFSPLDIRLRRDIIEIAEKYRWTQMTTLEKIKVNLKHLKNPYFRAVVEDIF